MKEDNEVFIDPSYSQVRKHKLFWGSDRVISACDDITETFFPTLSFLSVKD